MNYSALPKKKQAPSAMLRACFSAVIAVILAVSMIPSLAFAHEGELSVGSQLIQSEKGLNTEGQGGSQETADMESSEVEEGTHSKVDDVAETPADSQEDANSSQDDNEAEQQPADVTSSTNATEESTDSENEKNLSPENDASNVEKAASEKSEAVALEDGSAYAMVMAASEDGYVAPQGGSSAELAPGTYTVSANVSMMTPLGIRGYATNPVNPEGIHGQQGIPASPVTNSSQLVVGEDGSRTLTIDVPNPVFTVQGIGSSDQATAVSNSTSPIELKDPSDPQEGAYNQSYNDKIAAAGITTRITSMTVELKNWSGTYQLANCSEYATTLGRAFDIPLDVTVDLANAQRKIEGDYTQTFVDEKTGISVTAYVQANSSLLYQIAAAELRVEETSETSLRSAIDRALKGNYNGVPDYSLYTVDLYTSDGGRIAADATVGFEVTVPHSDIESAFLYKSGALTSLKASANGSSVSFGSYELGTLALVTNSAENVAWLRSWSYSDAAIGTGVAFVTNCVNGAAANGVDPQTFADVWYSMYEGSFRGVQARSLDEGLSAQALSAVASSSSLSAPAVEGLYAMGVELNFADYGTVCSALAAEGAAIGLGNSMLTARIPVSHSNAEIYLVQGDTQKGISSFERVPAQIADGSAYLDIVPLDAEGFLSQPLVTIDNKLISGARFLNGETSAMYTSEYAYYVVVGEAPSKIEKPTALTDLTYNGQEQTGVAAGEGYDVSLQASGTNAGSYTALATLDDGYVWADGTSGAVTLNWSITAAELTATYAGETIELGATPASAVEVTGFVNGETADTAADYVAPHVVVPASLEADTSYDLTPEGGAAKNYTFAYVGDKLHVKAAQASSWQPGTYSITANLSMPGAYNPVLSGVTVYANSPDNPFADKAGNAPVLDGNASANNAVPMTPVSMNATLIVGADGTKTLVLPVQNPVFTTQELGTCSNLSNVQVERTAPADASNWSYGKYSTRISKIAAQLTDSLSKGTASYTFGGSRLYAVPLDTDITPTGDTALQLDVEYSTAKKVSESTTVPDLNAGSGGNNGGSIDGDGGNNGGSTGGDTGNSGGSTGGDTGNGGGSTGGNTGGSTGGNTGSTGGSGTGGSAGGSATTAYLRSGTYTVTSNIWVSRESSGLPLSPHLTSSVFPPKDPVSNNATLSVDGSGRAMLTVPITVDSRVMTVQSIAVSGYNIVSSESSGGNLTSITIDLGVLENPAAVLTRSATVGITMGTLASTISGITGAQSWGATFEVNFSGVPTTTGATLSGSGTASGQGSIPDAVQAILDGNSQAAEAKTEAAAEAALAATADKNSSASSQSKKNAQGTSSSAEALAEEVANNPALTFALGSLCTLVVGGAAVGGTVAYRKNRAAKSKVAQ